MSSPAPPSLPTTIRKFADDVWSGGRQQERESITDPRSLRWAIRTRFRQSAGDEAATKERIREALEGLKLLNQLDVDDLVAADDDKDDDGVGDGDHDVDDDVSGSTHSEQSANSLELEASVTRYLDAVEWLPALTSSSGEGDADIDKNDDGERTTTLPLFPLSGPILPASLFANENGPILPLFTQLSDVPVPSAEIPLKIFEPRYRQLYNDAVTSGMMQFVVPFAHPQLPAVYARYGVVYEITRVEDVADQTNGQIYVVADHAVRQHAVRIDAFLNPSAWETRETYVKVRSEIVDGEGGGGQLGRELFDRVARVLKTWKAPNGRPCTVAARLLNSVDQGLWPVVSAWLNYLQVELLQMQVGISAEIQVRLEKEGVVMSHNDERSPLEEQQEIVTRIIRQVQDPNRQRLLDMHMEIATLVPRLLQRNGSLSQQCDVLIGVFKKEEERRS